MCRFIFYLGAPIKLSTIVSQPSHSLLVQSLHSNQSGVALNADGFGISWYVPEITPIPGVFKDITPAWSNINLRQLSRVTKSGCIMAHVRAASAGAIVNTNCHPFTFKNFSFMHNGTISYFSKLKREIYNLISDSAFELIKGTTDSEVLFALFISNYEKEIGYVAEKVKPSGTIYYSTHCAQEPEEKAYPQNVNNTEIIPRVLQQTILQIHQLILKFEIESGILSSKDVMEGASLAQTFTCGKLNLAVTDGNTVVISRYVTGQPENAHSLYWCRGSTIQCDKGHCLIGKTDSPLSKPYGESLVISSEPLAEDFKCEEVPVNHMVIGNSSGFFSIDSIN
ncbi:hypothetical protein DICPUDRAFT_85249 [Dictyostelium purpureum]|uniref:Glutamine amidotransferase type-2 domain-containing protein n=1 Tax=Dictyostelium purpureum TaxID=5786 RepID=F1A562_DICPU|nr:uncharacterized protein DICPUDRAFT_85249 [Dictyostelium purpureum]EGC28667.1 hypothetical protein DICPUDRAFT_85249 [Dictyostelium purpureum]|eukprot:XP_003294805.1 hypothetical protein DICPUDRAFT_85249 [Dictyostelium purpureum]